MNLPDVEALVRAFLASVVAPVKVATAVPAQRPAEFVRAWRTGGAAVNRILDQPQITVQAWAQGSVRASEIAQVCRTALFNDYPTMPLVRGVEEVSGLYFDPDPDTNVPRYTFTVILNVRARRP
jgi:hypothetical protein